MSIEIVRRLAKNRRKMEFLNEGNRYLFEKDDDEEERVIRPAEEDDSTAPEQGNPDDYDYESDYEDSEDEPDYEDTEEYSDEGDYEPSPNFSTSSGGGRSPMSAGGESPEGGEVPPEEGTEGEESNPNPPNGQYVNPLDNNYAVNYTLGDEVVLTYANGTNSDLVGHVEGYDKEGFYRVKWDSGLTTNGITDIALADFVSSKKESRCICGCDDLITEGRYVVCDNCGRRIREATKMDHLTVLDKQRPKGKRMIRSEAHPMSTAARPNIAETSYGDLRGEARILAEDDVLEFDDYDID